MHEEIRVFLFVVFVVQVLLCFKVKNLFIKLLPVLLFAVGACLCFIGGYYCGHLPVDEGVSLGHFLWAIICVLALIVCGIGWLTLAIFGKKVEPSSTSITE